ncbi:MarR family winged helix-turn-helix transcriptional regulator [Gordonia sp. Z-3]|uniref:MarR family winged helix-turn-helix transcriptional regulator n=1 Tax=Gordonia sp. Z-3 TaxID=3115408 RepID=UPI002E2D227C|nr:MarR family winged helix-turn-helix transcriptional regulator [Gordonia sp. Z-3]MED5802856.1 MarR family winged helix-turn-helix transcriptional regulator [Gordonia sp. Z-3]
MSVWERLGFSDNLYATPPLPGNEEGSRLLVGRDGEVEDLQDHWASYDTHASVEGANGVGKTSLVAVAAYRDMKAREESRRPLVIPLDEVFQLTADASELDSKIYYSIARTLLQQESRLARLGYPVTEISDLKQWMQSPTNRSGGANASVLGFGGGGSYGTSSNTSAGFTNSGFKEIVHNSLRQLFPTKSAGSLIGVLDNMELLSTSKDARRRLEEMRDSTLAITGIRWVLCGSNGIVRSVVGSQRLTGRIADPIRLEPLRVDDVPNVIQRRIDEYRTRADAEAPVEPEGFEYLYKIMNSNLRIALKQAEEFTRWYDKNARGTDSENRLQLLEVWLTEQADQYAGDTSVTPRQWQLFDALALFGGRCSPSEYENFGFASNAAMRPHVKALEEANLLVSAIDEDDQRRRTIEITANGWLVRYQRSGYRTE